MAFYDLGGKNGGRIPIEAVAIFVRNRIVATDAEEIYKKSPD